MDSLAEELRRALSQRGTALADRTAYLRGTLADERLALAGLLDLFSFFPKALKTVVDGEWDRSTDAASRILVLRPLLRHLTDVSSFVDDWLSHQGTPAVPFYLLNAVEEACSAMGLGDRRAVVAQGPADNFTTVVADIDLILFQRLGPLCPPIPATIRRSPLALMRAPRFEGTAALWHPILLGHELAHIAAQAYDAVDALDLPSRFDFTRASNLDVPGAVSPGPSGALLLYQIAESWAEELICDAYAVRAFGFSAVSSLSEYLQTIGATDHLSDTHPPGRLRNRLMIDWLGSLGHTRLRTVLSPWQELASEPIAYHEEWAQFLTDIFLASGPDIKSVVGAWPGTDYDSNARSSIVIDLAEHVKRGIPGDATIVSGGNRNAVTAPDVIAAAWLGRVESFETPTLQLVQKSLDNLEFMRQWGRAGGGWPVPRSVGTALSGEHAVLSCVEIEARLYAPNEQRLVVSPLMSNSTSGASLDLRLGNSFIVFVRSGVASFDPIREQQDPRQVQRSIQLAWGDSFVLHPSELVLASTLEYLVLPADLTAQVVSRSSYGRLGLLSATAVQVHPHFHGCLTLELVNLGTVPLVLVPGERIAQLVLSPVSTTVAPPVSKYHCPIGPEFSKVRKDDEATVLRTLR